MSDETGGNTYQGQLGRGEERGGSEVTKREWEKDRARRGSGGRIRAGRGSERRGVTGWMCWDSWHCDGRALPLREYIAYSFV